MVELLFVIYFIIRSVAQAAKESDNKADGTELPENTKLAARSLVWGLFNSLACLICIWVPWLFFGYLLGDGITLYRYTNKK